MKRRILSLFLILCILVASMSITAVSDDQKPPECIRGIDYTRIKEATNGASMEVKLNLGSFSIPGRMEAGNGVARDDANGAIRKVMEEQGIESDFLEAAQAMINRTSNRYHISLEEFGTALAGNFGDIYNAFLMETGQKEAKKSDIYGLLTSIAAGVAMDAAAIEGAAAVIIGALVSLGYTELVNAYEAHKDGEELSDITTSILCAIKLRNFYSACNEAIGKLKKYGRTRIVFGGEYVLYSNRSFMGVGGVEIGFKAEGVLEGKGPKDVQEYLAKGANEAIDVFGGTYVGNLKISIDYHLEKFDEKFKDDVFLGSRLHFREAFRNSEYSTIIDTYQPTQLKKVLTGENVSVTVSTYRDRYTKFATAKFSLDGFADESTYKLKHEIFLVPDGCIPYMNEDGVVEIHGGGVDSRQEVSYRFDFSGSLRDNRYAQLNGERYEVKNNYSVSFGLFHQEGNQDEFNNSTISLMTDCDAFYFLSTSSMFIDFRTFAKA